MCTHLHIHMYVFIYTYLYICIYMCMYLPILLPSFRNATRRFFLYVTGIYLERVLFLSLTHSLKKKTPPILNPHSHARPPFFYTSHTTVILFSFFPIAIGSATWSILTDAASAHNLTSWEALTLVAEGGGGGGGVSTPAAGGSVLGGSAASAEISSEEISSDEIDEPPLELQTMSKVLLFF